MRRKISNKNGSKPFRSCCRLFLCIHFFGASNRHQPHLKGTHKGCLLSGAVTGIRTRDLHLTKVVLYRLSHNSIIFIYIFAVRRFFLKRVILWNPATKPIGTRVTPRSSHYTLLGFVCQSFCGNFIFIAFLSKTAKCKRGQSLCPLSCLGFTYPGRKFPTHSIIIIPISVEKSSVLFAVG